MKWYERPWVLAAIVALIGVVVYVPAVTGSWIYDDHFLIPTNPYVHSFHDWPRWFLKDFWNIGEEYAIMGSRIAYWRPSITATYALDWKLSGGAPLLFHLTNYAWQAGVGVLSFFVLRRWVGKTWPALLAAVFFVVHPTKAESVAWIAGRTDVICMAAVLLATQGIAMRLRGERGGIVLEALATVFAYTTKEQAIVLPAFAVVEGWVHFGRPPIELKLIPKLLRVAAPQIVVVVVYLTLRRTFMPLQQSGFEGATDKLSLFEHGQLVLDSIGRFLALTFAPHHLSIQQGLLVVRKGGAAHSVPYMTIGIVGVVAMLGVAFALRRRAPAVTLGLAFFLVTLSPTMNFVFTHMETLISERFLYLPILGISLAIGGCLVEWPKRWLFVLVAAASLAFGVLSLDRSADYLDEDAFWARELALHPESSEARRARVRLEIGQRRYAAAIRDALLLTTSSTGGQDVSAAAITANLLADMTPDHDRASLETLDTFAKDMLTPVPVASLEMRGLSYHINTDSRIYRGMMEYWGLRLMGLRSAIHSRLGDDAAAIDLAKQSIAKCQYCTSNIVAISLALARGSAYDDAIAVLDDARSHVAESDLAPIREMIVKSQAAYQKSLATTGPAQLQARATALATLEMWGRAYDVLAPYKDQIMQAPKFVMGFAELAVRAGEPQVAREVLASSKSPAEIEQLIAGWSHAMGWTE